MKINRLFLVNCLSYSPSTEYFGFNISKNVINFIYFTPNLLTLENEIELEEDEKNTSETIYINFSDFFSFVNLSMEEYIHIYIDKNCINLISGESVIHLSFIYGPKNTHIKFDAGECIQIPYFLFSESIQAHQKIIKKSPDIYSNLLVLGKEKEIQFQSTDVYRILSTKYIYENEKEYIISFPKLIVTFFLKNLKSFFLQEKIIIKRSKTISNYINMELDSKTRIYFFEGKKIYSSLEDIKDRFFYKNYIEIKKQDIVQYLKKVEIVSKNNLNVKYLSSLQIKKQEIEISSNSEKNKISCKLRTKNENIVDINININTNSTSEIIKIFPDEYIKIFFQDEQSPLLITGETGHEAISSVLSEI